MGTVYMLISIGLFTIEIVLQVVVMTSQSQLSQGVFIALLAVCVIPVIVINIVSAIKVIRAHDFSGKPSMRAICVAFHSIQLGLVWRALKLFLDYNKKDWSDFVQMRLFHSGFQSLPFAIILSYRMFIHSSTQAITIISVIVSLLSAAFALSTYRTSDDLYDSDELDKPKRVRRIVGIVFLTLSYGLVLFSRCSSIVLFSVVEPAWIALPLSVHFLVSVIIGLCRTNNTSSSMLTFLATVVFTSFVDIFEKVGKGYTGVKCSYVFYYSMLLIEDLVIVFYWMLAADYGERLKLMTTVVVIVSFIMGVIIKFASCGCIYNIESDILSEAFTNPELKEEFDKKVTDSTKILDKTEVKTIYDDTDNMFKEVLVETSNEQTHLPSPATASRRTISSSEKRKSKGSKYTGSSTSSTARKVPHDNRAFANSQGNISAHSPSSLRQISKESPSDNQPHSITHHRHSKHSRELSRDGSPYSNEQYDSHHRRQQRSHKSQHHSDESHNRSRDTNTHNSSYDNPTFSVDPDPGQSTPFMNSQRGSRNKPRENNLIISDTSIYNTGKPQKPLPIGRVKGSNVDIASSKSRYSRNTNTLNGSVLNYHYNGFDDPYRERRAIENNKSRHRNSRQPRQYSRSKRDHIANKHAFMDYSLDSSELYPSMTSDSESMTSYEYSNRRHRRANRYKSSSRRRQQYQGDGYSTDVSNSDYLSFNDYSMDDSSSWTESSDSESAITWPPSHSSNMLKMYDISQSVSSKDNVMHWLDTMGDEIGSHDASFSTLDDIDPSIASETDISLSAMQDFEVTKPTQKKKFKKLIPKPKDMILKFRSLNYKNKQKHGHKMPYPVQHDSVKAKVNTETDTGKKIGEHNAVNLDKKKRLPLPTMPLPIDSVQESIV